MFYPNEQLLDLADDPETSLDRRIDLLEAINRNKHLMSEGQIQRTRWIEEDVRRKMINGDLLSQTYQPTL